MTFLTGTKNQCSELHLIFFGGVGIEPLLPPPFTPIMEWMIIPQPSELAAISCMLLQRYGVTTVEGDDCRALIEFIGVYKEIGC